MSALDKRHLIDTKNGDLLLLGLVDQRQGVGFAQQKCLTASETAGLEEPFEIT